jgi:hypothetical protein
MIFALPAPLSPSTFPANTLTSSRDFLLRFLADHSCKVTFCLFSKTQIGTRQVFKFKFFGTSALGLSLCAELSRPQQILFALGHPRDPELIVPSLECVF